MPAASSTCFIFSLSRNGIVYGDGHAGQPELLADLGRQDHVRLPQAFHLVEPHVRGEPAQGGQHGALVGQRHVLVVGEGVAGHSGQLVRRLVADADHPRADGSARARVKYGISAG